MLFSLCVAFAAVVSSITGPVASPVPSCLLPPVAAPVVDPFRDPGCVWCPGHRGLTYALAPGVEVRAAAAGTVTFSGVVAGTRYVVVEHSSGGLRATYGGLASARLEAGDVVVAGGVIGSSAGALHFGLRRGPEYLDPAPLLGRLVERARLVPTDDTARRAPSGVRLECGATGSPETSQTSSGGGGWSERAAGGRRESSGESSARTAAAALPLADLRPSVWVAPHHDYPAIDVMVPTGTTVRAWHGGTVRNIHANPRNCAQTSAGSRCRATCGIGVTVVDASWPDVTWTYCHMSVLDVRPGDVLAPGQVVGRSGNSGRSGAPHLHVEVRVAGSRVCPQRALSALAAGGDMLDPHDLPRTGCSF